MATQMVSQPGGNNLFGNGGSFGMGDMYGLHDLSKAEMAAPRLIMLANVALTGEVNSGCCDYSLDEDRQMAELTTVYENSFSESDGERLDLEESNIESESGMFETMEVEPSEVQEAKSDDQQTPPPETRSKAEPGKKPENPPSRTEDKTKSVKSKPFRCRPCQYKAESEEEFVHHIKDHSAKRFIDHDSSKNAQDSGSCSPEEVDFSKGPIRCDRCGYNTNRFDHYLAHLKHHNKASDNERVYKCTICTYTTVSEYHWKKHLRNHFPRIVYSCSQCSYFSDRKNNYIQHIRTHTGERPYQCVMCPYSSSQKTHLTRHMRTHSGEKPFKCEQCSYVASNQHEVTRHARQVHNGPKPLTCPHCNYKTADRSNFKKHVELHVNPRQFLCPVCDYAASKKCNLQYHIKSRHSGCADITMDVSKVKLRTKKGDVAGSDVSSDKKEKENTEAKIEAPEKKSEVKLKAEKEKCLKVKQAAPPVGHITTRSHKPTSSKTEEDTNLDKGKSAKRKASVLLEKPTDVQNTNVKKRKLVQKTKHTHDVPRKAVRAGRCEKKKVSVKKTKHKKTLKNKHKKSTIAPKAATVTKGKSSKSTTEKDSEEVKLDNPVDMNTQIQQAEKSIESVTETVQEKVLDILTTVEDSNLSDEGKIEESTISDVSVSDLNSNLRSPAVEITPETDSLPSEMDSGFNMEKEHETPPAISPVIDEPVAEPQNASDLQPSVDTIPLEKPESVPEVDCSEETSGPPCQETSGPPCQETSGPPCQETSGPPCQETSGPPCQETSGPPCQETSGPPCQETSGPPCSDSTSEESENVTDSPPNRSSEEHKEQEQTNTSNSEQVPSPTMTKNINDCHPKETGQKPCEATTNETLDMEEDEGIHSHEGSDISDSVSERSDDSGVNGLQSPQETLESPPLLEVPSVSTSVSKESFVCIFCDRVFKKAEEYTKHLKRHLVNVYYLEKAAQNRL